MSRSNNHPLLNKHPYSNINDITTAPSDYLSTEVYMVLKFCFEHLVISLKINKCLVVQEPLSLEVPKVINVCPGTKSFKFKSGIAHLHLKKPKPCIRLSKDMMEISPTSNNCLINLFVMLQVRLYCTTFFMKFSQFVHLLLLKTKQVTVLN